MSARIDLLDQRFGRLVVVGDAGRTAARKVLWHCSCDCGKKIIATTGDLRHEKTTSCGCLRRDRTIKLGLSRARHGHSRRGVMTPEYRAWQAALQRCSNKNNDHYDDYGGRGISVCQRWSGANGFDVFIEDMGAKPEPKSAYSLERKDNRSGYNPENCCWATRSEQTRNRRPFKSLENYSDEELRCECARRRICTET